MKKKEIVVEVAGGERGSTEDICQPKDLNLRDQLQMELNAEMERRMEAMRIEMSKKFEGLANEPTHNFVRGVLNIKTDNTTRFPS